MPLTSRTKQQPPRYSHETPAAIETPAPVSDTAAEETTVDWSFYAFCSLTCIVSGMVDGASLAGVYHEATSHLSGISTKMALRLHAPPPLPTTNHATNLGALLPFWSYFHLVCTFGLGTSISGFVLIDTDSLGQRRQLHVNKTLGAAMPAAHRALIATCVILLSMSSLVIACINTHVCIFTNCSAPGTIYAHTLLSMTLASCACGLLNGLVSSSKTMVFRVSHMTGTVTDAFLLLGFCVRTMSLSRVQLHRIAVMLCSFGFNLSDA